MKFNLIDEENNYSVLLIDSSSFFLSHQISINHRYFSLIANQHQPPATASRTESRKMVIASLVPFTQKEKHMIDLPFEF
jgi:hypothetical protein